MKFKITLFSLIVSAALNFYLISSNNSDEKLIVANEEQVKCLESKHGIKSKTEIYGPEIFNNSFLVSLNTASLKTFEFEASSCFYNSVIENVPESELVEKCSAQLNQDTFFKEFCSYSTGDRSPLAV